MVVRAWFLILLLASGALAEQPAAKNLCLSCHPRHYTELGSCTDCHRGFPGTTRINIAHSGMLAARFSAFTINGDETTKRGQKRLENYACRRCHTSDQKGNKLAANLDLSQQKNSPKELEQAIRYPVLFMPEFNFTEGQRIELINAILYGGRNYQIPTQETPSVVHFEGEQRQQVFQFEKSCGNCHRALTEGYGGLGQGLIGPNLSGLFSEFYPKNHSAENLSWNPENLQKWLKNPRKIRPLAQMAPVELKSDEFDKLKQELQPEPVASKAMSDQAPTTN